MAVRAGQGTLTSPQAVLACLAGKSACTHVMFQWLFNISACSWQIFDNTWFEGFFRSNVPDPSISLPKLKICTCLFGIISQITLESLKHKQIHMLRGREIWALKSQPLWRLFLGSAYKPPPPAPHLPGHASRPHRLLPSVATVGAPGLDISPQDCACDGLLTSLPASKSCSRTILLGHPFGPVTHSSASIFFQGFSHP